MNDTKPEPDAAANAPLSRRVMIEGAAWNLFATLIWGAWMVVTGHGVQEGLDAHDIAAIRLGIAGLLMIPFVLRMGFALDRLGWFGLIALVAGAGAPFVLTMVMGMYYAPVGHASALINGLVPVLVAAMSLVLFKERISGIRLVGLALILGGAAGFWLEGLTDPRLVLGHVFFLVAAILWSSFIVTARYGALSPVHAAAIVSVLSLVLYVPFYFLWFGPRLILVSPGVLAVQIVYQGALTGVIAVVVFVRGIALIGASRSAAFLPLAPVIAMLLAGPAIGQWPNQVDLLAMALVCTGVFLATGIVGGGRTS